MPDERISLPSDPEQWVELKAEASYADVCDAEDEQARELGAINGYYNTIAVALITDHNLLDPTTRQPLVLSREIGAARPWTRARLNLRKLRGIDGIAVDQAARKRDKRRPEELEVPFETPSTPSSSPTGPSPSPESSPSSPSAAPSPDGPSSTSEA